MSTISTCYICGKTTPLQCMTPGCARYFCSEHGDFMCQECHKQSQGQQVVMSQKKELRENIATGVVGVLIAILVGIVGIFFAIIREIFRSL